MIPQDLNRITRYRKAFPEHAPLSDEQVLEKLEELHHNKKLLDTFIETHHTKIRRVNLEDIQERLF